MGAETWRAMDALERFASVRPEDSAAGVTWFRLGDRDLATHLYRTQRLAEGAPLSQVTDEIRRAWSLELRLVPVTDDRLETRVTIVDRPAAPVEVGFQEYFVGRRHAVPVTAIRVAGADGARPAPGVLEAIRDAEVILIAPSNPIVSVGTILAVPGIRAALAATAAPVVAISPIVGGAAIKGPAAPLMQALGYEVSARGVAACYAGLADVLVIDNVDAALADDIRATGMDVVITDTIMRGPAEKRALAQAALVAASELRIEN